MRTLFSSAIVAVSLSAAVAASAQVVKEPDWNKEWTQPYEPFRIVGNLYYVGTYDLCSYIIATPQGHILINTGMSSSADGIKKNMKKLGLKFSDIKILLNSQAHFDHLGAMAEIKKRTGATLYINEHDAQVAADGGSTDFALHELGVCFKPVKADRLLHKRDTIALGGTQIIALHHPGHTKGSTGFLFDVKDGQRTYKVFVANMPTIIPQMKLPTMEGYEEIGKDFGFTLEDMKRQHFDLWFAAHASQFKLHEKHKPGDAYNPEAFRDQAGYEASLAELDQKYRDAMSGK